MLWQGLLQLVPCHELQLGRSKLPAIVASPELQILAAQHNLRELPARCQGLCHSLGDPDT